MKLNLDASKTIVCKEETLLCIFKDVPNFFEGEDEISTIEKSYSDILLGKQGPSPFINKPFNDSDETFVLQKSSQEANSTINSTIKLQSKKLRKKNKEQYSLGLGSSTSEESSISDDCLPGMIKKRRKTTKKNYRSFGNPNLTLSIQYLKTPESDFNLEKKYTSSDELCSECLWLVRTAKDTKVSSSSEEDDEIIKKWKELGKTQLIKQTHTNSEKQVFNITECNEMEVLKLLNEVHMRMIECSIILTTHKLNKKVKKRANDENLNKESPETMSDEKLLDEIQEEENSKVSTGTSKLCLFLGKLVSKYLKT